MENSNITAGQVAELIALFAKKMSFDMSKDQGQYWIDNPKQFGLAINSVLIPENLGTDISRIEAWGAFYKKFFNITLNMTGVQIPAKVEGFDRLIVVAGVGLDQVWKVCKKQFNCCKYTDSNLGEVVIKNDRNPNAGVYAIWIRDRIEADEETKNLSANDLAKQSVNGITLLERLIFELKYFSETGKHLDIENVTLCSGSRSSYGSVPFVFWSDGRLGVGWGSVDCSSSDLRSRVAVSLG